MKRRYTFHKYKQAALKQAAGLALAGLLLTACGGGGGAAGSGKKDLAGLRDAGTIRVSNTQANPPYSFVNASNQLVGYDVDVAKETARRMGIKKVKFVVGSFETFIPGLQAGKWDAVVSGLTITDERKQQVDFSCPYQVNDVSIFAKSGTSGIGTEKDLQDKRIAVSAGSTQEELANGIDGAKVLTYSNSTLALRDVATGRADAYIGSKFTGAYLADKNNLDVAPNARYLSREVNAMAFPMGEGATRDAANRALASMIEDGTLSKISRKWLGGLDMARDLSKLPAC